MGQRLNIEVVSNERTLANAYYHWSDYTGSAIELTKTALLEYEYYKNDVAMDQVELAIRMLEATGAGVNDPERLRIKRTPALWHYDIQPSVNRNEGLLCITEAGIKETELWEEGRVTINIDDKTIAFGVYFDEGTYDEWVLSFGYEADEAKREYEKLPVIDFDFDGITFDNFYQLERVYEMSRWAYGFRRPDGTVITWIV